ncbi:MAG TPA: hypothetical protein PKN12_00205 [Bacteroidales bacterium]|nr:hypothetical protein [Bacteroidales bacterium]HPT09205.1 hypothetical protein [Bacteroidales bacterium]
MKRQTKIIIGSVIVAAVVIIAISFMFPSVFKGITSGTFGKADKYRKTQMTEQDIMLRSELVSDTGKLRSMIQGLIYFSLFTEDLSAKMDSCVDLYKSEGICNKPEQCATVSAMADFSDFIRNNNKTLRTTISMLTGFYLKDQSDESADVEMNLRAFGTYVTQLNEKDSILEQAFRTMDSFMLSSKTLQSKQTELTNLKSIRDQLLISGIQLSGLLQDKPMCATLCSYALSSQQSLNALMSQNELRSGTLSVGSQENIKSLLNGQALEKLILGSALTVESATQLEKQISGVEMGNVVQSKLQSGAMMSQLQVVVYDRPRMQFLVCSKPQLERILSREDLSALLSGQTIGVIAGIGVLSNQGMNLYQPAMQLNYLFYSQEVRSFLSSNPLSSALSAANLGSMSFGSMFMGGRQELNGMVSGTRVE